MKAKKGRPRGIKRDQIQITIDAVIKAEYLALSYEERKPVREAIEQAMIAAMRVGVNTMRGSKPK